VTVYVNVVVVEPLPGETEPDVNVGALFVTVGPVYVDVVAVAYWSLA
jgi:hypothetical protein